LLGTILLLNLNARKERMGVCFKCSSTEGLVRFGTSAAYLAPRISLCRGCIGQAPKHERDREFACGCTDARGAIVERHWQKPWIACPACQGNGRVKDRHHYLQARRDIGATDERERLGYSYSETDDPLSSPFPGGGWVIDNEVRSTGRMPGRPRKARDPEVLGYYLVDVLKEVVDEHRWAMTLQGADLLFALDELMNLLLHRAKGPSSRDLAEWFEWSNRTIDRRRKKGQQLQHLFEQMNRIENLLQHTTATDELRWAELFRQFGQLRGEPEYAEDLSSRRA
jgi:hypothetical protein